MINIFLKSHQRQRRPKYNGHDHSDDSLFDTALTGDIIDKEVCHADKKEAKQTNTKITEDNKICQVIKSRDDIFKVDTKDGCEVVRVLVDLYLCTQFCSSEPCDGKYLIN